MKIYILDKDGNEIEIDGIIVQEPLSDERSNIPEFSATISWRQSIAELIIWRLKYLAHMWRN